MSLFRPAAALASFVLLSACLTSTSTLITPELADYPIADGAKFTRQVTAEANDRETVVIRRKGDFYYYYGVKDGAETEEMHGRLKEVAPNTFLSMGTDSGASWLYGLYVRDGESYMQYGPTCSDVEAIVTKEGKRLSDFGTAKSKDKSECEFKSLEAVTKAMLFARDHGLQADTRYDPAP